MKVRTVAELWKSFEAGILMPIGAPPNQREEMRRAFYSGVKAGFKILTEDITELSDDDGVAAIETVNRELNSFVLDLLGKKGNA